MAKKVKRVEQCWAIWSDYGKYYLSQTFTTRRDAREVKRLYIGAFRVIRVRITEVKP